MSILIEGMEMPTSCDSCRIMEFEDTNCVDELYCGCPIVFEAHPQGVGRRPDYCPLTEVPEPHGDLIDRDAARGSIKPWSPEDERNGCTFDTVKKLMHTMLDRAPTVIPASESEERPAFLPTYELTPRKTNADRIRAMSDEELADLLVSTDGDFPPNCEDVPVHKLEAYWLDWLKQEAE